MNNLFLNSTTLGVVISLLAYQFGVFLKNKTKKAFVNPLLISIVLVIVFLLAFDIDYASYNQSAKYLSYLLTPATVSLAIPLYQQLELLKKNMTAIILGISAGVLTSLLSVLAMSVLFGLNHEEYVTLLPKSITTAIGMGISEELGGYPTITVAVIIVTGIFGNMIAEFACKLFRIKHPISKGLAIGTSSHAMGTTKALELGQIEGAMSSLSIVVAGLMTVILASFFAMMY
ncbi:MAG: LrgB family protein [Tyzzerella sp.]|nr:LrgB family protein [Tyzzerella sp.]